MGRGSWRLGEGGLFFEWWFGKGKCVLIWFDELCFKVRCLIFIIFFFIKDDKGEYMGIIELWDGNLMLDLYFNILGCFML